MTDYPFVQSHIDLGLRRGPVLGFIVHMAEGGATVAFLAKANPNSVSVHYVIETSGRIVQMLREDRMHSSIRIRNKDLTWAIRGTDDPGGFFGATAARAVMGDWWRPITTLGPNHASIAVEIEGYAVNGPNAAQAAALARLVADVRSRHSTLRGTLGHRDFASYKACPGRLIDWLSLGGHGLFTTPQEVDVPGVNYNPDSPLGTVTVTAAGVAYFNPATRNYFQVTAPREFPVHGSGTVPDKPDVNRPFRNQAIWIVDVGGTDCWVRKVDAGELVAVDICQPRIAAALEKVRGLATASVGNAVDTVAAQYSEGVPDG